MSNDCLWLPFSRERHVLAPTKRTREWSRETVQPHLTPCQATRVLLRSEEIKARTLQKLKMMSITGNLW